MITIDVNGLLFEQDGPLYLKPGVKGLFKPNIRTSSGNYTGRDGGWLSSQYLSTRTITIPGAIYRSCVGAEEMICEIQSSLEIRQLLPIKITTSSGVIYYTEAYLIAMDMDLNDFRYYEFQIILLAPDPNFYIINPDDPDAGWVEQQINTVTGGGYLTPYILPVIWEQSSQPTLVVNTTDQTIYPQIILEGKFTNPKITNNTTGQFVQINATTSAGDTIIIDMNPSARTVTLNGSSILPAKSGNWWGLAPGDNLIELESDGIGDNTEGTIRYRPAYSSIFEGIC